MFAFCKTTPCSVKKLHAGFRLPIEYINPAQVHTIPLHVADDLELCTMYNHVLRPTHDFAKHVVKEWGAKYSTNDKFLRDTQEMIRNTRVENPTTSDKITEIWQNTKENVKFLETYSYIEWDCAKSLNESPSFLQVMSVVNMSSPILSFIIPIIFFVLPFVLLKVQGVTITFTAYLDVLKNIARHHFIGSFIQNIQSISWDKLIYLIMTVGMYMLQIYQNYNMCIRFYTNINRLNENICDLTDYISTSIENIDRFIEINENLSTYTDFCSNARKHSGVLRELHAEISSIQPFRAGFSKITEIGYMLKCYYKIHADLAYEDSIQYAVGFDGFLRTITGLSENLVNRHMTNATFTKEDTCIFTQQYYPAYVGSKHVKNTCNFNANCIITGPNASGKTTMLKTTLLNLIFTQQFGCGFYQSCILNPYTHIHSYLNIPDTSGRDSLFQAESRRCKDILDIITSAPDNSRHFCIFDELYSGTNPSEAVSAAHAFLLYLNSKPNVTFMLTTHYVTLCKKLKGCKRITNYKMDSTMHNDTHIEYLYKLKRGISTIKGGVVVLANMNYPSEILETIRADCS